MLTRRDCSSSKTKSSLSMCGHPGIGTAAHGCRVVGKPKTRNLDDESTESDGKPGIFLCLSRQSAPDAIRTHDTFFRREVLYPLSYRGNGNYCTTKWDLGRSLVCGLAPFPFWRS